MIALAVISIRAVLAQIVLIEKGVRNGLDLAV